MGKMGERRLSHGPKCLLTTLLLAASAAVGSVGCSDSLEDGYQPRRLGSSTAERKSYYASPYTPESIAARRQGQTDSPDSGFQRPGGR